MAAVIRCDPLDGVWQTLGTDRYRGIVAESIEASANPWGPDQLSFMVKTVEPAALRPDLLPYTPVELEVDGMLVWSGRVKARPSTEQEHSVQCEGLQYHLDDDVLDRVWVHTRLGDYRDTRTFLTAPLGSFTVAGQVATDGGAIAIGWPNGAVVAITTCVGVTLDLGPSSTAKRLVMTWNSSNNDANAVFFARACDSEDPIFGTSNDFFSFAMNSGASGTSTGTVATARRYVHLFLIHSGSAGTLGADVQLQIKTVQVFRDTAYESGNASILMADTVIKDARALAPLLSQSDDYITAGTFAIPEAATQGYQSPREIIEWANAYENFRTKVGGPQLSHLVYDVKPTLPLFEVGEWSGAEFADASVSGEEIYSRALVDGSGPDGARIVSSQTQTGTLADRNGVTRTRVLPIRSAMTQAVADRFADLWLDEHRTAPFAGKLSATNGIRRFLGGGSVPAHEMLLMAGERINFAHRLDPDTGAWGRVGTIAGVRYREADESVEIDIDDRRDHFEKILGRYGILVDQIP